MDSHEKNGPVLLQNAAWTALGTQVSGWFIGGTRKERRCFAAECGPDPFGHTRALEGPFSDPRIRAPRCRGLGSSGPASISGSGNQGRSLRRQILFVKCAFYSGPVADLGGDPFPKMWPPLNRVGAEFIGVTRKERPCFAAERGLDRLGHGSLRMLYWGHTKGTALFCCRMRPRPLWAHTSTRGSIF